MKPQRVLFSCSLLILCLLASGCGTKTSSSRPVAPGVPCQDVLTYPQDLQVYADTVGPNKKLASLAEQQQAADRQKLSFYRPWKNTEPSKWVRQSLEKNFNMNPSRGYSNDKQPFPMDVWDELVANSNKEAYGQGAGPGITLRHTNLRAMPTGMHYYLRPDLPGEGYPFDYFQHSSLPAGTPLYICNISKDGQWILVESPVTSGWMPMRDVASVDESFMDRWQSKPLAAIVREKTPVADEVCHIGTLLPLSGDAPRGRGHSLTVLFPIRGDSGRADIITAALPADAAVSVPLSLTPREVALVGNEMMGQTYGWGGLDEKRDCSALTRDLFAPFGLFLPRNSTTQSKVGLGISLAGLSMPEKETVIQEQAVPFSSLLWFRGHIVVYLGQYQGKGMLFHNMWGLRTRDAQGGCDGRAIVGKGVVTTWLPGVERSDLCDPGSFLERFERLSVIPGV